MVNNSAKQNNIPKQNPLPVNDLKVSQAQNVSPVNNSTPQQNNGGKFLRGLEKGLDMFASAGGGSLLTAPFRAFGVAKNAAKNVYNAITGPQKLQEKKKQALYQKAQKQKFAAQQKQLEKAQQMKQKEAIRQKLAMEKGQAKEMQKQFKQNVVKGDTSQAMKQLFPGSYRPEPVGIKNPTVPKPGEKFVVNKTSPNGLTTPVTLKRPKPRMTQKRKLNQKIGQGLSNPTSYEDKIKNIMGVN